MQNVSSVGQSSSVNENGSKNYGNLYPNDKSIYGGNTTMFNNLQNQSSAFNSFNINNANGGNSPCPSPHQMSNSNYSNNQRSSSS